MRKSKINHADHDVLQRTSLSFSTSFWRRVYCATAMGPVSWGSSSASMGSTEDVRFEDLTGSPLVNDRSLPRLAGTAVRDEDRVSAL